MLLPRAHPQQVPRRTVRRMDPAILAHLQGGDGQSLQHRFGVEHGLPIAGGLAGIGLVFIADLRRGAGKKGQRRR